MNFKCIEKRLDIICKLLVGGNHTNLENEKLSTSERFIVDVLWYLLLGV